MITGPGKALGVKPLPDDRPSLNYGEKDDGRSCYEPTHTALVPINRLLKQRDDLAMLCGEILATLRLPSNEKTLDELGIMYKEVLGMWRKRFEEYSGNPN